MADSRQVDCIYPLGPLSCPRCDKIYASKDSLTRHVREIHFGETFNCFLCSYHGSRRSNLRRHYKRKHQCTMPDSPSTKPKRRRVMEPAATGASAEETSPAAGSATPLPQPGGGEGVSESGRQSPWDLDPKITLDAPTLDDIVECMAELAEDDLRLWNPKSLTTAEATTSVPVEAPASSFEVKDPLEAAVAAASVEEDATTAAVPAGCSGIGAIIRDSEGPSQSPAPSQGEPFPVSPEESPASPVASDRSTDQARELNGWQFVPVPQDSWTAPPRNDLPSFEGGTYGYLADTVGPMTEEHRPVAIPLEADPRFSFVAAPSLYENSEVARKLRKTRRLAQRQGVRTVRQFPMGPLCTFREEVATLPEGSYMLRSGFMENPLQIMRRTSPGCTQTPGPMTVVLTRSPVEVTSISPEEAAADNQKTTQHTQTYTHTTEQNTQTVSPTQTHTTHTQTGTSSHATHTQTDPPSQQDKETQIQTVTTLI